MFEFIFGRGECSAHAYVCMRDCAHVFIPGGAILFAVEYCV
jgi:hypothetical protein